MKRKILVLLLSIVGIVALSGFHAGSVDSSGTLFDKYGGYPTIKTVVDQSAAALLADPITAPFFVDIGKPGHDTVDRLLSCLDLQFSTVFGGPYTYPSISKFRAAPPGGYACRDMKAAHVGLGITSAAFDRFVAIVAGILAKNGVTQQDINTVAPVIIGLKDQVVGQ